MSQSGENREQTLVLGLNGIAVGLLLATLTYGSAEMLQSQLLRWGESFFPGYHELRSDIEEPSCNLAALERDMAALGQSVAPKNPVGDELDALLLGGDEKSTVDAELDDLLADGSEKPAAKPKGDELDALLDEPQAESKKGGDDELDALLGDGDAQPKSAKDGLAARRSAYEKAIINCTKSQATYRSIVDRTTVAVKAYRTVEGGLAAALKFGVGQIKHILILMIMICGLVTTIRRHHISLRPISSQIDIRVSETAQLLVNLTLAYSAYVYRGQQLSEGSGIWNLPSLWLLGFAALAIANFSNLLGSRDTVSGSGSIAKALLTIPLYTTMGLVAALYFLVFGEARHEAGLLISVSQLTEYPLLYLQVGLYVWVGMLLKRTQLASMCFDALRPWRLPPELLAFVAVVGAALPTAYSGASGIFVIAAGAIIYEELRKAGARNQLALAATAMSGSMGVVLRPCLLVVVVASVNKEVTTGPLYDWGFKVFLLTAFLFLLAAIIGRREKWSFAPANEAVPGMMSALRALGGYFFVFLGLLLFYGLVLDKYLDETAAPMILPVLMIGLLLHDQFRGRLKETKAGEQPFRLRKAMASATSETSTHIGALLLLMGLSLCVGAVIERSDVMTQVPQDFGSIWLTMSVLVFVLVLIGMTMDPYGAVILVSATLAGIAANAGIHPVHFWMVVLVAFELGYLTPPVALNHLLTRQVVGDSAADPDVPEGAGFWLRHERILLPVTVMATALLLVAFIPLTSMAQSVWSWFN